MGTGIKAKFYFRNGVVVEDTIHHEDEMSREEITDFCDTFVTSIKNMMMSGKRNVVHFGRVIFNGDDLMMVEMDQSTPNIEIVSCKK